MNHLSIRTVRTTLGIGILLGVVGGCGAPRRPVLLKAQPLTRGDTIAFVAPAGPANAERVARARDRLEAMGFVVRVPADLCRRRGYLAGDDETRARELMDAFRDPQVAAVFPVRGGYGTTRLLDRLDFEVIRKHPKLFIGYSDITALHLAIQKRTGLVTFHSPMPMYGLGSPAGMPAYSARYFWRALRRSSYFDDTGEKLPAGYVIAPPAGGPQPTALVPGVARGRLTGGNLSLIVTLMGTPYEIDTDGAVLFLEDIDEKPYRIDRYLSQLRLGGKLEGVAAVILGQFTNCAADPEDDSLTLAEVFQDYFADLGVPVLSNFSAGHTDLNATLPLGVMVEVNADAGTVTLLEDPVHLQ